MKHLILLIRLTLTAHTPAPQGQPIIDPVDIQRTAPARPEPPPAKITPAAARSAVVAQPIQTDRTTFYEKASAAVSAGKIQFDKFNSLVSKANRHGYAAALEEMKGIV